MSFFYSQNPPPTISAALCNVQPTKAYNQINNKSKINTKMIEIDFQLDCLLYTEWETNFYNFISVHINPIKNE